MPGTCGGAMSLSRSARPPLRSTVSVGFTAAARTRMRTSPGPGSGSGRSTRRRTSGPPNSVIPTARMVGESTGGPGMPGSARPGRRCDVPKPRLHHGDLPGVYQLRPRPTTDGGIYRSHGSPVQHARRRGRAPLHMVRLGERFPHRHVGGACHLARVIRRSGGDRPLFPARPKRRVDGLSAGAGGRPMAETRAGRRSPGSPGGVAMARVDRRGGGLGRARHRHGHPRGPSDAQRGWPRPIGR